MTISVIFLSFNRAEVFKKCVPITIGRAGYAFDEIIWVDNGSEPKEQLEMAEEFKNQPTVSCFFKHNTGVSQGLNTALSLCRSDHIVVLAPDVIMPDQWLKTLVHYMTKIPNTGIISVYSVSMDKVPERHRHPEKKIEIVNGLPILKSMPIEAYMIKRSLHSQIGYYREDFGMYGWMDCEWAYRAERVLNEIGLISYTIPGMTFEHMSSPGAYEFKPTHGDTEELWKWKKAQSDLKLNYDKMEECREKNWPFWSPF